MNLGGLANPKLIFALFASTTLILFGNVAAAQQNRSEYSERDAAKYSRYGGETQQLNQQQSDQLAQIGGQAPSRPLRPFPELSAEEKDYLNRVLDHWQTQSEGIDLYECQFERYMYDNALTNYRDPETQKLSADSVARGIIKFGKPGKALYETKSLWKFVGHEKAPPETSPYMPISDMKQAEKWVTDGEKIYEFDYESKRIYETKLPPEMRGGAGAIENSPIPFLFGARKDQILDRYWVRVITPRNAEGEVWLEAWPRRADDAQNYLKVEIILSIEPFLPKAIHMYMPQYNPRKNNYSSVYVAFSDQKVNSMLAKFKNFFNAFVRPSLPLGWKFVPREQMNATAAGARPEVMRK